MKTLALRSVLVLLSLSALGMVAAGPAAAVHGNDFDVMVQSSFGTTFTDCLHFDANGELIVNGLGGQVLLFDHDRLGEARMYWQATSQSMDSFQIGYHGRYHAGSCTISGNAVNEFGDTFIFRGMCNQCTNGATAATRAGSPYRR